MKREQRMRKEWKKRFYGILGTVLLTAAVTVSGADRVSALNIGGVEIHGYGHQGYLLSDGNTHLEASSEGSWNFNTYALVFTAKPEEKTTIWAQIADTAEATEDTKVDWAFVDYQINDNLTFRGGRMRFPMGLYNEIRDAKFLHLSTLNPSMYDNSAEIIHEAFHGIGLVYNMDLGEGRLILEPVVGEIEAEASGLMTHDLHQMYGARTTYETPIEGLSLAGSFAMSNLEMTMMGNTEKGTHPMWIASLDYVNHGFDIKAEFARIKMRVTELMAEDAFLNTQESYYIQAGYTIKDKWTPFTRFDYINTFRAMKSNPAYYQKHVVTGIDYKINYNIALKAEYHVNNGYALPVLTGEETAGSGKKYWQMFAASISFIF